MQRQLQKALSNALVCLDIETFGQSERVIRYFLANTDKKDVERLLHRAMSAFIVGIKCYNREHE